LNTNKVWDSDWLKAGQHVLQNDHIKFLDGGTLVNEGTKDQQIIFKVQIIKNGFTKKFGLNKTNGELMKRLYGPETNDWIDKEVACNIVKARNPKTGNQVDSIVLSAPNTDNEGNVIIE